MNPTNPDGQTAQPLAHTQIRDAGPQHRTANRNRLAVNLGFGLLIVLLIGGVTTGVLVKQVFSVRSQLLQSVELVKEVRSQLEAGDQISAQETFSRLKEQTSAARSTATGPIWKLASLVPLAGPNFSAVREVAVSADDLATKAASPLLKAYASLDLRGLSPEDGRIDIAQLQDVAPSIVAATDTVRLSHERMASVDLSKLLTQVADPVRSTIEKLDELDNALTTVSSAVQLLPAMLGADEPRSYLVLVQNSAELRATGGIPGALAVLNTDNGNIELGEQGSASALGAFIPSLEVDEEQEMLYTPRLGTHMQNVNLTPDFPTAANTAKRMWEERHSGQSIDGVLALDPVVLSHLLDATGPVSLVDPEILRLIHGTSLPSALTSDNVVPTLLSDVYREIEEPQDQDAYFSAVAAQIFSAFTNGQGDGAQLINALTRSAKEERLYLWSSYSWEQDIIASTPMHGSIAGPGAGGTAFGVYFNDGTGAKMDYYVKRSVQLVQGCRAGEYGQYTVRVTASNNAPADAGTSLPAYVTGGNAFGVQPGRIRTNYVVYGPSQAFVETATVDGKSVSVSSGRHGSRPVGTVSLELRPGETSTIEMVFSGVVQDSEPQLRVTPTIQSSEDVAKPLERVSCG